MLRIMLENLCAIHFLSELIDDYKKEGQVKHVMNS
jgi:hypothetical protein